MQKKKVFCDVITSVLYSVLYSVFPLRYEFKTKERDVAFAVKRLDENGKKPITVLEKRKYHCYLGVPEDGKLVLSKPGTCKYMGEIAV